MKMGKVFDDNAGKLGPYLGRDGVERTHLTNAELERLFLHSQNIKVECDCHMPGCKTCREIGKLKWYSDDYRIIKALVDELAKARKEEIPKATLKEISEGILWLNFENSKKMCSTFLRFQEHYESPEYSGKYFSLDEFRKWYMEEDDEEFTYYEDWGGFNIPSWVLDPFLEGKFNPLSREEEWFLSLFRERKQHDNKFYIIGTWGKPGEEEALKHETAHGLFYVNPSYKKEVQEALKELSKKSFGKIKAALAPDYSDNSMEDEIHAYTMEELSTLDVEVTEDVEKVSTKVGEIHDRYGKEAKSNNV
jgi:hypothetical protein